MAPHSSTLAWKIPWMEESGGLQTMRLWRVGHDWATSLSLSCIGERNGNPLQYSCLENPRDGGVWWAAIYGVAQSRTRLKRLSSSSSSMTTLLPNSSFIPSPIFPLQKICFLYLWDCFYSVNKFICIIFLDSTYKWYIIFVFLCLTYFT